MKRVNASFFSAETKSFQRFQRFLAIFSRDFRVHPGEVLWFVENSGDGLVRCRATVKNVFNSEKLSEQESQKLILDNQTMLCLTPNQIKRWGSKRYLVLIEVEDLQEITPFSVDRSSYGNMDDWLPAEDIESIKK